MNELQIFDSGEFGTVRTYSEPDGTVLFCGSDVAKALGYANSSKALSDHCKGVTKRYTPTAGGSQEMSFIPEGDIYRLAARSNLPSADRFERWIFDEVLPAIRRHGAYMTQETIEAAILDPDTLIKIAVELKRERQARRALEAQAEADRPKVLFADAVSASRTSILIGDLAKLIKQNGVDIGANRLFEWLRENGYLIRRKGSDYNSPTQRAMELGLFTVKETAITHSDGCVAVSKTTKVTGKGQQYFVSKFLERVKAR